MKTPIEPAPDWVAQLQQWDERSDFFEPDEVLDMLWRFRGETSTPCKLDLISELAAFQHSLFVDRDSHASYYSSANGNADITSTMLIYWIGRAEQCTHPVLKFHYADLAWWLKRAARIAIAIPSELPSLIMTAAAQLSALSRPDDGDICVRKMLARALCVAVEANNAMLVQQAAQQLWDFELAAGNDSLPGTWGWAFSFVLCNKGAAKKIKGQLPETILADMHRRFARYLHKTADDRWLHNSLVEARDWLISHCRKRQDKQGEKDIFTKYLQSFIQHHLQLGYVQRLQIATDLQQQGENLGLQREAEKLEPIIRGASRIAVANMHELSGEYSVTEEKTEHFLSGLISNNLDTTLVKIACYFLPAKKHVDQHVKDAAGQFVLSQFAASFKVDGQRVVAATDAPIDDQEAALVNELSMQMEKSAPWLRMAIEEAFHRFSPTSADLSQLLSKAPVFASERLEILNAALDAYLAQDWKVALHLFVPQIEAAMRVLAQIGNTTSILKAASHGGQHYRTLEPLLASQALQPAFGPLAEDLSWYLTCLLCDDRCWNIRNNLCHGLLNDNTCNSANADRIFHALLLFAAIRSEPKR